MNRLPINIKPAGAVSQNNGDEYETHKFDIKYLLECYAEKESDVVWDPFVARSGYSQSCIEGLGYKTTSTTTDFFHLDAPPTGTTLIITNPPFSKKVEIMKQLCKWSIPFILILPTIVLQRDYFTEIVKSCKRRWWIQLPNKSLFFHVGGEKKGTPAFKCCFIYSHPSTRNQPLASIDVQLIDYEEIRRERGFKSGDIALSENDSESE